MTRQYSGSVSLTNRCDLVEIFPFGSFYLLAPCNKRRIKHYNKEKLSNLITNNLEQQMIWGLEEGSLHVICACSCRCNDQQWASIQTLYFKLGKCSCHFYVRWLGAFWKCSLYRLNNILPSIFLPVGFLGWKWDLTFSVSTQSLTE